MPSVFQKHYRSNKCCWCGIELTEQFKNTKEHLLPQSVCGTIPRFNGRVDMGLIARACGKCNRSRGGSLGPPNITHYRPKRSEGWATRLWKEGMAPWIVYPARHPEILIKAMFSKRIRRKLLSFPCLFEMGKYDENLCAL